MDLAGAVPQPGQERQLLSRSRTGSGTRFSGAPLWRFTLRKEEQRRLQEEESKLQVVPEGFVPHSDGWYWNPQQKVFWQSGTQKYYLYSEATKAYTEIQHEASIDKELRLVVDASCIHRQDCPREDRHVIIRDLAKAAQALRMPIDHFARPVALFAVYVGHRPWAAAASARAEASRGASGPADGAEDAAPTCAEFCARNLPLKLLPRLSEFKGPWDDVLITTALRASCDEVDADFLARPGNAVDGCSAVIGLFTGRRLFLASVGDAVGIVVEDTGDGRVRVAQRTPAHSPDMPSELSRICAGGGSVTQDGPRGRHAIRLSQVDAGGELLHVSRAFGDRAFKVGSSRIGNGILGGGELGSTVPSGGISAGGSNPGCGLPSSGMPGSDTSGGSTLGMGVPDGAAGSAGGGPLPPVIATPDIRRVVLQGRHLFLALVSSEVATTLAEEDVAETLRRHTGRPRVACGELLQAAQARGAEGSLTALCVFLDWGQEAAQAPEPPAKKPRVEPGKQVRCRQILVKHRDCKEPVDRVRSNRPVTRSLADAERVLREALEAIQHSPEKSVFTQRCKAVSECSTCLKGGEMAGDLGWLSRGQAHPTVEAVAFSLPVGHISDIVESDEGVHVLWRIA
mmetsp:Transcript_96765/g.312481  ORF Transcript_96765/g.312481 Transcript_96765/m.312481 type:complete len:626 (+) Transcript_96765:132-2009(+)